MSGEDGSGAANRRRASLVKRNLFGTLDHQQIQDDLKRELKRIADESSKKWNFDFENFKPLSGRFKWERVGKRLQTRKSPTEQALPAENVCQTRTVEAIHVSTRYNLRTREKGLGHISDFEFRPIEPAAKQCKIFGDSHVENGTTGHREKKRRPTTVRANAGAMNTRSAPRKPPKSTRKQSRRSTNS